MFNSNFLRTQGPAEDAPYHGWAIPGTAYLAGTPSFVNIAATTNRWANAAYGNGIYVVTPSQVASNFCVTSPDGITWTQRLLPANVVYGGIKFLNGKFFLSVGYISSSANYGYSSPDGITWTLFSMPTGFWNNFEYGNNVYVAVTNGSNIAASSTDGTTWTSRTCTGSNSFVVAFGAGVFVTANSGTLTTIYHTSSDGTTWTQRVSPTPGCRALCYVPPGGLKGALFAQGGFVAAGDNGGFYSVDGITWTTATFGIPQANNVRHLSFAATSASKGYLISTTNLPTIGGIQFFDGSTWTQAPDMAISGITALNTHLYANGKIIYMGGFNAMPTGIPYTPLTMV